MKSDVPDMAIHFNNLTVLGENGTEVVHDLGHGQIPPFIVIELQRRLRCWCDPAIRSTRYGHPSQDSHRGS